MRFWIKFAQDLCLVGFFTCHNVANTKLENNQHGIAKVAIKSEKLTSLYGIFSVVGFMILVLIDSTVVAIVGFAMAGFGAANVVPQLVSFAAHINGMAVHNIISFINALGYSGILFGPVIIGFVGKQYGLHISFWGIAVFALIVSIVSFIILKTK